MGGVVLDITRSISRVAHSRLTGIDRVELAYIDHFLQSREPVAFLARVSGRVYVLDRAGMTELRARIRDHGPWDRRPFWRRSPLAKVVATLGRLAVGGRDFGAVLAGLVPAGFTYIHVGHSSLPQAFQQDLRRVGVGRAVVLVHDTIPLDFPQFCREETRQNFARRLRDYLEFADILLCNSTDTARSVQKWTAEWGLAPVPCHVIPLGVDPLPSAPCVPAGHPYFITLGTIEPRKNHRLLLDIWQDFDKTLPAAKIPHLYIVGARGWMNEDVFNTLDTAPFMGRTVFEKGRLPDQELGPLIQGARALLFPSFAEGFGYPLVEALQQNTPVICSDLPSFRELAGEAPIYLDPSDKQGWQSAIVSAAPRTGPPVKNTEKFPDWGTHFHILATILS